jgi:NAD(P)H-hydrate epimerase
MPTPVISIAQMREWENATWSSGQTEAEVIRRVGKKVADRALQLTHVNELILILAGKGHNGDDARSAREHLVERRVEVFDVNNPETDFAKLETLLGAKPALVIDGLFGIGINRPLDAAWIKFIERINAAKLKVLAVDVPSGLNGDTGKAHGAAAEATVTFTIGAPKRGMLEQGAWPFVGRLEVANDVGLIPYSQTSELNWILPEDFSGFPPARPASGHKGSFGHLAIIAGSLGYHGAAVLASRGAQRGRPGLITVFPHESAYYPIAAQLQAPMVRPWVPDLKIVDMSTALLAGPGLAAVDVPEDLKKYVRRLWRDAQIPMVVDASALDWLPTGQFPKNAIRVITPHPGEAARLLNTTSARIQADRVHTLRGLSEHFGNCWVVLKGHQTLIGRSDGEILVNSSGNPGLAQGGAGDVLAGYLAGLLAQPSLQVDVVKTICFAVWQHGATADFLEATRANWIVEDLAEALGRVMMA